MYSNDMNSPYNDAKNQQSSTSSVSVRDLKTQNTITEIMQILQEQKEAFLKEKQNEHKQQTQQRKKENLDFRKMQTYQKSMALRSPFLSRPRNSYQYFEQDSSKYLKKDPQIPDKEPDYYMLPERAKNPLGFHIISGKDSANYNTISKNEMERMGKKERMRFQIWEEIRKQKEKEQQDMTYQLQDGRFKRTIMYDSKKQSKQHIFKPTDSRSSLFTSNPSSVYDVPRTPRSNQRLIQLTRNLERNQWNPNNSVDGVFDKDIYKFSTSTIENKSHYFVNIED